VSIGVGKVFLLVQLNSVKANGMSGIAPARGLRARNAMTSATSGRDEPGVLRREVREALTSGLLPLARPGSIVRRGTYQPCFICKAVIDPGALEREVRLDQGDQRVIVVHEPCYLLWRVETMAKVAALERP
jgi:hypothetical protein